MTEQPTGSQEHFQTQLAENVFYPPADIEFVVYSKEVWKNFLAYYNNKRSKILDLGCGGGTALSGLEQAGFVNVYGTDFVSGIPKSFLKHARFCQGDVLETPFISGAFDGIMSTMVIEHVDERKFIKELHRLLRQQGVALISSVYKKKYAWYFYKNVKGEAVLEPSHLKEYTSVEEFLSLFENFDVLDAHLTQLKYPFLDPIFKLLYRFTRLEFFKNAPTTHPLLKRLRKIRLPILGYYAIEAIVRKK